MARRKDAFLAAYAVDGFVGKACRAAGVPRSTYYHWREADEDFAARADHAYEDAVELAEEELRRRAVGIEVPVLTRDGQPVYKRDPVTGELALDDNLDPVPVTRRVSSERLLEFYMKGNLPRKYRDRLDHTLAGPGGGPVSTRIEVEFVTPSQAENSEDA